jgi:uncharacterized protein YbjT (DUF2867 family)
MVPLQTCVEDVPPLLAKSLGVEDEAFVVAVGDDEAAASDDLFSLITFTLTRIFFLLSPPLAAAAAVEALFSISPRLMSGFSYSRRNKHV